MRLKPATRSRLLESLLTVCFLTAFGCLLLSGATFLVHFPKSSARDLRSVMVSSPVNGLDDPAILRTSQKR